MLSKTLRKIFILATIIGFMSLIPFSSVGAENLGDKKSSCGGVDTAIISCSESGNSEDISQSGVWGILRIVLNIMVVGVGIAAIGGFVFAAVLYASAGDSQEQVKKAKDVLRNVMIGLVLFAIMFLAVNYLVPGGVLN